MGLDMYLNRHRYIKNWDYMEPDQRHEVTLTKAGQIIPLVNPAYIVEEVGYWRKANHIHKFFCDLDGGKDECQEIYVETEALKHLVSLCKQVLKNHSLASTLLPTQEGFFFGGTTYDQYYLSDLEDTIKICEPLLQEFLGDLIYRASW